jgi:PAS domain S-box-containing protein
VTSRSGHGLVERHVRLDPVPESARQARQVVSEALVAAGRPELDDSATLLVSELVTNAIMHARTFIDVVVAATATGLYVGVNDRSDQFPARRDYGAQATTGRGLALVDVVATRHGVQSHDDGSKTVWFELGTADETAHPSADEQVGAPNPAALHVTLRGMPLRLARAWQQHVAALMREYLLLVWELDGDVDRRLAEQALAADALADVATALDAVPLPRGDGHADVTLELTPEHGRRFDGLDVLLDAILGMDGRDDMLTPRMQPEMRTLRRWICAEVRGQLAGLAPLTWSGLQLADVDPSAPPLDWDASAVQSSELAMLAADDANRIIAASPSGFALLGWNAEELVGERIAAVVPPRLREQFIAAFSEHLLTGETSILDRRVVVPALRRNGTEVLVEVLVRQEQAAGGRAVFIATLRLPD